jgi:hypothetical protein
MAKSENDSVIPWYLRVIAAPFLAIGAAADAVRRVKDKVKGR